MMTGAARVAFAITPAVALAAGAMFWFAQGGISAMQQPSRLEAALARRLRHFLIPRADRRIANPVRATPEAIKEGMAHFADHCATCHANNGSGDTEMGRNLYPRAPDMRLAATQSLSDGELFYIIENGVRFTGMPGWSTGTPQGAEASWHLVQFIRHLPALTRAEEVGMAALNPKSLSELEEEMENQRFLNEPAVEPSTTGHEGMKVPAASRPKHQHELGS